MIEAKVTAEKPRLWVVSEPFYPDENTTAFHMTRFAEGLAEHFDVKALCGQPSYSSRGVKAPKREVHNGVEIFRSAGTTLDKDVLLFRLTNMFTLGITMFFNALKFFQKGDRILAVTAPPTLQFITAAAALRKGASYSLLVYDVYPDAIIAAGKMKPDSFFARTIDFLNRWLYKHAARIFVIGRDMERLLSKKSEGLDIPIFIVPNCAETDFIHPRPKSENALLIELDIADKFVLLYSGNMGRTHDLESIVECAAMLVDQPQIHFLFIGDGGKKKWIEEQKKDRSLGNVTILGLKPRAEQPIFLNACDVSLISLNAGMNGISVPS
nr:glycosyltransferase family 4 protein [Blastocatellia bacterium]